MKLFQCKTGERTVLVAGVVKSVRENEYEGKEVLNIVLEGKKWDPEEKKEVTKTINIAFWDNEDPTMPQMATSAKKAGIGVGAFVTVNVFLKDENDDSQGVANAFKYPGHVWCFKDKETGSEKNIVMGTVCPDEKTNANYENTGRYKVAVPIKEADGETVFHQITFWNNENANMAERAKKVFDSQKDKHLKAVIICGKSNIWSTESGDIPQYSGYRFDIIPDTQE